MTNNVYKSGIKFLTSLLADLNGLKTGDFFIMMIMSTVIDFMKSALVQSDYTFEVS